jgi:AcrR family transcriptional regulator
MPRDTFFNLPDEKRQKIMAAAVDQFSKFHYSNVTIDRIVRAAEIPKGSFYQYFENKDDLYIYLFTEVGDTKLEIFESIRKRIPLISFKEYMWEYIMALKKLELSNDQMPRLKREFLEQCPQHIKKEILKIEMPKSLKVFKAVIDAYIEKKEFRKDLNSKTAAYISVVGISNLEFYDYQEDEEVTTVLTSIIDFLAESMR